MEYIYINNFSSHNPREDQKKQRWFKLENDIIFSQSLFGLNAKQKWFWIFILSLYSKRQHEPNFEGIEVNISYFSEFSGLEAKEIVETLGAFIKAKLIQIVHRSEQIRTDSNENVPTYIHTYIQNTNTESNELAHGAVEQVPHAHRQLLEIWNKNSGSLPKALDLSPKREKKAKARWKEVPDVEYWEACVRRIAASRFCTGKTGGTWVADFDFFLQPDTHLKVLEGKYDSR